MRTSLLLLGLIFIAACNGPNSEYEDFGDRVNTKGFGHKYAQPEGEDELVLGPGDALDIQIANNPQLSGTQSVRVEGVITAPFLGSVKVAGLTPTQIRDKLQILLTPYIRDVSLQVVPVALTSKRIYIYATDRYGTLTGRILPISGDMTLIDLITTIGGVPTLADDCHVKVIRGDPRHPKTLTINARDMIINGYTAANIQMRPDDIVYMPPTFFAALSQTLLQVTLPLRTVSQALRSGGEILFLAQDGTLPRRGAVRRGDI